MIWWPPNHAGREPDSLTFARSLDNSFNDWEIA